MSELEITPEELAEQFRAGTVALVDVREPEEFVLTSIAGAELIPLSELSARIDDLPQGELVIYCHHGIRSLQAVALLQARGRNARSLKGGIDAWALRIDPSLPRY